MLFFVTKMRLNSASCVCNLNRFSRHHTQGHPLDKGWCKKRRKGKGVGWGREGGRDEEGMDGKEGVKWESGTFER
jgi:hypothetical protein